MTTGEIHSGASQVPLAASYQEDQSSAVEVVEERLEEKKNKKVEVSRRGREPLKPANVEVWLWYVYELCSYFVHTVLIPMVFPMIIAFMVKRQSQPGHTVSTSRGFSCWSSHLNLYKDLTEPLISLGNSKLSPLEWTAFSWATGLVLVTPAISFISINLDYGWNQQVIAGAATALGAFLCLPVGFSRNYYVFPLFAVPIVMAITVATASHSRHYGLMVRGYTGPYLEKHQFSIRRGVSSWLSLFATASGCIGSALISTFLYYMLRLSDKFDGLWIVSIFSGLKWVAGSMHLVSVRSGEPVEDSPGQISQAISIFKYPHATGGLIVVGLSSFTTMCIFGSGLLFLFGELCMESKDVLFLFLTYFILPLFSLPLIHFLQFLLKSNAVKMQILGLIVSLLTSGFGFYYGRDGGRWKVGDVLVFGALQGTSVGVLHAFGRVLVLDCCPGGSEGAFSVWLSWVRLAGACAGYALASRFPGDIRSCFRVTFLTASAGILILLFGNISDVGGAVDAGNVIENENGKISEEKKEEEEFNCRVVM